MGLNDQFFYDSQVWISLSHPIVLFVKASIELNG